MGLNQLNGNAESCVAPLYPQRIFLRQIVPALLSLGLVFVLWDHASRLDFARIRGGLSNINPVQWALAGGLSILSFWAVGRYDLVLHRIIGNSVDANPARHAGIAAIAIGQSVGFGLVSGAFVRWRMLPDLTLPQSLRLTAAVSFSFLAGWAVVTSAIFLVFPPRSPFEAAPVIAGFVLLRAALTCLVGLFRPAWVNRIKLPSFKAMGTILALVLVDTLAAGGALYALLPQSITIALPVFLCTYLLALGVGLVLGSPGGVGAFEATILFLLPQFEQTDLLSAILAFRVVYYLLPALIGAVFVIRGPIGRGSLSKKDRPRPDLSGLIQSAPSAESALLRYGRVALLEVQDQPGAMVRASAQSLIHLGRPLTHNICPEAVIRTLQNTANAKYLTPCLYKAPPRLAAMARRSGWHVAAVAREGWITPKTYCTDGRAFRQLRRKLRKATQSGLHISEGTSALPLTEMSRIADSWARVRGGERGFSMGTFDPALLPFARIFLIWQNSRLVGFITLHENQCEQVLDLIRVAPDAPDGALHLALDHAIRTAGAAGCPRLSLAAVPIGTLGSDTKPMAVLRRAFCHRSGGDGLYQFKASFAPTWRPLYIAAPGKAGLCLAALDILHEITRPAKASLRQPAPRLKVIMRELNLPAGLIRGRRRGRNTPSSQRPDP